MSKPSKLKLKRLKSGLTQYELSLSTGIVQPRLSLIENGLLEPTKEQLEAINKGLDNEH